MTFRLLSTVAAMALLVQASVAQVLPGNLAVFRVGDGATALVNSAGPISIVEYTTAGAIGTVNTVTATGANGLQVSGTATSEGNLTLTGNTLTFAGYNPGAAGFTGTGSLSSRTAAQAPRAIGTLNVATGAYALGGQFTPTADYSAGNVRGAVTTANGVYGAGSVQGINLAGTGTTVSATVTNTRVIQSVGSDLVFSTGSGVQGLYRVVGNPTTTGNAATPLLTAVTGQGTSPYAFSFSPNGSVLYVADSNLGVQKFTVSGSTFTFAYNLTAASTGITGLAVDYSGTNPVLYATNPANLFTVTDAGSAAAFTSIATPGTNFAFRGLSFVQPVPEPATVLGVSALGLAALGFVRRRLTTVAA